MSDTRKKNAPWSIYPNSDGSFQEGAAQVAVLMDLRDELQAIKKMLRCPNCLRIPQKLDRIARAVEKRKSKPRRKRCT